MRTTTLLRRVLLMFLGVIAFATFLFARDDQREKNRWVEIKINTDTLKAKYFDAFIALPRGDDSLRALCAALPDGSVWYSQDGYGRQWLRTQGLEKIKVNQFIAHEEGREVIYACSDSGLYRLTTERFEWKKIGLHWPAGSMSAVCFGQAPDTSIYAASGDQILKLDKFTLSWKQMQQRKAWLDPNESISALLVAPADKNHLVVGTDNGVYTLEIKGDSVRMDEFSRGSPKKVKTFLVGGFLGWGKRIIAVTEEQGSLYCSDAYGRGWWPMSNGLQREFLSITKRKLPTLLSLTLDSHDTTKACVATTKQKKVMRIKFYGIRVGFFEMHSVDMHSSEVRRFADRVFHGLAVPEIVELTRIPGAAISSRDSLDARLLEKPELREYELLIWGEIGTNTNAKSAAVKKIELSIRRQTGSYTVYTKDDADYAKYYPLEADKLAQKIKRSEFKVNEPSLRKRFLWQGNRKFFTLAATIGLGVHILAQVLDEDEPPPPARLPMPPKFPRK